MDWEQISKVLQQVGVVIESEYLPKFLDSISIAPIIADFFLLDSIP